LDVKEVGEVVKPKKPIQDIISDYNTKKYLCALFAVLLAVPYEILLVFATVQLAMTLLLFVLMFVALSIMFHVLEMDLRFAEQKSR
jgi:hypothetical protein